MTRFHVFGLLLGLGFSGTGLAAPHELYVDYSAKPNPAALVESKLSIVQPHADIDLEAIHASGGRVLGYLSLVEIAEASRDLETALASGVATLGRNEAWKSRIMDVSDPRWKAFLLEKLARPIADRGWDGFFLDTADSVALVGKEHQDRIPSLREGLVGILRALRETWPDKQIVMNRGFDLLPLAGSAVNGILIESVFQTHDAKLGYQAVDSSVTQLLLGMIGKLHESGHAAYVLDYVDPGNASLIKETEDRIRKAGAVPFISVPALDGGPRAGFVRVPRKIMVLYGFDPGEAEKPRTFAEDTLAAPMIQLPLEAMGYEVFYHNMSSGVPPVLDSSDYCGIVFDEEIELPYRMERPMLSWLGASLKKGLKVLFLGGYGFDDAAVRGDLFKMLGLRGEDLDGLPQGDARFLTLEAGITDYEAKMVPTNRDFENLRAPEGAQVIASLAVGAEGDPSPARYDPVYTCSWGGAILAPYVMSQISEETRLHFVDPFAVLGRIWPEGIFPAPDVTTRDGLRIFFTHVDGDGFSSLSTVIPGKTCAEVLEEKIIKDLPWPISISVVESEMRGEMLTQKPGESDTLKTIARRILALPNVEPASHSYSHPYVWRDDDMEYDAYYERANLELKPTVNYPKIEGNREVAGSLEYITKELCPPGKPARLMLWSGNCRPSEDAILSAERFGATHLNGGNTILSRRFPGLAAVAPKLTWWDDIMQVYAPNQNEFYYTDGWEGEFHGGFAQVIDTFEMTGTPRRLKPVNVYYHFYSVEHGDALAALRHIYDWCAQQPLHVMWASEYGAIVRDSFNTTLLRSVEEPETWLVQNAGQLRTLRMPVAAGLPDLARCEGVSGWNTEGGLVYIHTTGVPEVKLTLSSNPEIPPHLRSSTGALRWQGGSAREVSFSTHELAAQVVLAGFTPGATWIARIGADLLPLTAAPDGTIRMDVPARTEVLVSPPALNLSRK